MDADAGDTVGGDGSAEHAASAAATAASGLTNDKSQTMVVNLFRPLSTSDASHELLGTAAAMEASPTKLVLLERGLQVLQQQVLDLAALAKKLSDAAPKGEDRDEAGRLLPKPGSVAQVLYEWSNPPAAEPVSVKHTFHVLSEQQARLRREEAAEELKGEEKKSHGSSGRFARGGHAHSRR
eukprot:4532025-Pleurochrysis_carterae.AAC.1